MTDKRRTARKRSFLTAYATLQVGGDSTPCLVRDLSQTGARVMIEGPHQVPQIFDLHVNGRDKIWRVETVWRRAGEVGVRLLTKVPVRAPLPARPPVEHPGAYTAAAFHGDVRSAAG